WHPRTNRGGLPALPPVVRRLGLRHQVLNGDLLITLEARARRGLDPQRHLPVDRKPGDPRAAPALRRLVLRGPSDPSVAFSIPDGLCGGRGGKSFNRAPARPAS